MKIGILTFHCADNYGAMLQSYATLFFLRKKGFDTEIINYKLDFLKAPYTPWSFKRILRSKRPHYLLQALFYEIALYSRRRKRKKSFDDFFNQYLVERDEKKVVTVPDTYDVYIVGSDQVWNTDITLQFIDAYFCKFKFSHSQKIYISYAASVGKTNLSTEEKKFFKENLKNFDALSVREDSAKQLLQPYVEKNIKVVLDPTLLLDKDDWARLATSETPTERYVLVYQVREHPAVISKARDIAEDLHAKVVQLVAWPNLTTPEELQYKNPQDFISLIKNAACVITTSFHATAFSINFEVPFYVINLGDGKDGRSKGLLDICGLKSRIVSTEEPIVFEKIDYSKVKPKLEKVRSLSCDFLLDAIAGKYD